MSIGEMGENFRVEDLEIDFLWGIWGGEVLGGRGSGFCMVGRNGFVVGFLG